ncbi:MAG: heavy-metal-associated domain-containing protein [Clostridiaceae bacterium]
MKKKIKINGMSCEHCIKRVKNAMEEIEGVSNVQIDLSSGVALFDATDDVKDGDIKYAVEDAGYDVVNIEIVV